MTTTDAGRHRSDRRPRREVDTTSLAILFVCVVAIALGLVGIAQRGTTPLVLVPAVLAGVISILRLYRTRQH